MDDARPTELPVPQPGALLRSLLHPGDRHGGARAGAAVGSRLRRADSLRDALLRDVRPGRCSVRLAGRQVEPRGHDRSEEHTSELQSLMRISYAVFCLTKKKK